MTGLGRAVLMVCSVDTEFTPLFNKFCFELGRYVGAKAVAAEYDQRKNEALRWVESGSFAEVAHWVNGKKSPGPGHRVGSKKEHESETSARYVRESLASIGFHIHDGRVTSDGTGDLSKLDGTFFGLLTTFISRGQRSKPKVGAAVPILSPYQDYQLSKGRHDSRNFGFGEMATAILCSAQAHSITCGLQRWEDAPFEVHQTPFPFDAIRFFLRRLHVMGYPIGNYRAIYNGDRWDPADYAMAVEEVKKLPFSVQTFLANIMFVTCDGNANNLHSRTDLAHNMDRGFEEGLKQLGVGEPLVAEMVHRMVDGEVLKQKSGRKLREPDAIRALGPLAKRDWVDSPGAFLSGSTEVLLRNLFSNSEGQSGYSSLHGFDEMLLSPVIGEVLMNPPVIKGGAALWSCMTYDDADEKYAVSSPAHGPDWSLEGLKTYLESLESLEWNDQADDSDQSLISQIAAQVDPAFHNLCDRNSVRQLILRWKKH
ncbi:unnamed protein product [Symbiodinium sp. CCMP2592]|nr:unnamed protein product [Symbiodinium sp. CCMP2592]